MQVAIYLRISTRDKQDTKTQLHQLQHYAELHNYNIYDIYADKGHSGAKASRPNWDRLLADMRRKKFDGILVYKLDRIGRSISNLLALFKEFDSLGIKFISATQNIDTTTPEGRMFRNMLAVFAEYERELTIGRVNDGLDKAIAEGKRLGRPKGKKDTKPRKKAGYFIRWSKKP